MRKLIQKERSRLDEYQEVFSIKEIGFEGFAVEAVRADKDFLKTMKVGDSRAIVLRGDIVVVFAKKKDVGKCNIQIEISVIPSISIDAKFTGGDLED